MASFSRSIGYEGHRKPILYPIIGPHEIGMTRNFPMKADVPGEHQDHPHHQSLWFTHGEVNGENFWSEEEGTSTVVHEELLETTEGADSATIVATSMWIGFGGDPVCSDRTTLRFSVLPIGRVIDWTVTVFADQGDLTFMDTKEGTMGIRVHPRMRFTNPVRDIVSPSGHAVNSEGDKNVDAWGKRAAWVDYWAEIEGNTVGIAVMDHPSNLRHPTWWHARSYGLVAANPFGEHDFEDKPPGTGDYTIAAGESLTLSYRFVFHEGDTGQADVAGLFEAFGGTTVTE